MKSLAVPVLAPLVLALLLGGVPHICPVLADVGSQHQTFTVSPDASEIRMTLNTTHEVVNGTFHIQSGSIDFDRSSSAISGSVVVLAASGKTGNDSRDKKMNKDSSRPSPLRPNPTPEKSRLPATPPSRSAASSPCSAILTI